MKNCNNPDRVPSGTLGDRIGSDIGLIHQMFLWNMAEVTLYDTLITGNSREDVLIYYSPEYRDGSFVGTEEQEKDTSLQHYPFQFEAEPQFSIP